MKNFFQILGFLFLVAGIILVAGLLFTDMAKHLEVLGLSAAALVCVILGRVFIRLGLKS